MNTPISYANTDPEADKQKLAMARRLEQLNAALGETDAAPACVGEVNNPAAPANARRCAGTGSLLVTSMLSTLLGAGAMWLVMQPDPAPMKQPTAFHAPTTAMLAAPITPAPEPISAVTPKITDEKQLGNLLEMWRSAWMQRDIAAYLNTYSKDFSPADGSSRDDWVAARTKKLSTGAPIDIQVSNLDIERIDADHFKLSFLQDYASGSYREMARAKTLLIVREGDDWRITKERLEENRLVTK
jgi:hypothetical protein